MQPTPHNLAPLPSFLENISSSVSNQNPPCEHPIASPLQKSIPPDIEGTQPIGDSQDELCQRNGRL